MKEECLTEQESKKVLPVGTSGGQRTTERTDLTKENIPEQTQLCRIRNGVTPYGEIQ